MLPLVLALIGCLDMPPALGEALVVSPSTSSVRPGQTVSLSATLRDVEGKAPVPRIVEWASSDDSVAIVSGDGVVTGVTAGAATITATSDGLSGGAAVTVVLSPPGTVDDLAVRAVTESSVVLSFTEVDDGSGRPAAYDVRYAPGTTLLWNGATSVSDGTCATPLAGTAIRAARECSVLGLAAGTPHAFELIPFRGTLNATAVFGELSNIATGATTGSTAPVASVSIAPDSAAILIGGARQLDVVLRDARGNRLVRDVAWTSDDPSVATVSATGRVRALAEGEVTIWATSEGQSDSARVNVLASMPPTMYYSTNFNDGTTAPLDVYAYGGGSCARSADYRDAGSVYSIKCVIPAGQSGAAALQAWFGRGRLAHLPSDPTLDQDLFQQVRFVLASDAASAIGGVVCTLLNRNSQFKVHKSVYGQAGSAWNGWVMSNMAPCKFQGMVTEAEMWNVDQQGGFLWPNTFPTLSVGTVYDVVYRYHRYTAQDCGTAAAWVNGEKIMDTPCLPHIGTTNGSPHGLLFWDGAVYLEEGLGSLTVYTLFTRAANFPIGGATSSP